MEEREQVLSFTASVKVLFSSLRYTLASKKQSNHLIMVPGTEHDKNPRGKSLKRYGFHKQRKRKKFHITIVIGSYRRNTSEEETL